MLAAQETRQREHKGKNETHMEAADRKNVDDAELLADVVEIVVKIADIAEQGGCNERLLARAQIACKDR